MLQVKSFGSVKILSVDYDALLLKLKQTASLLKLKYPEVFNVSLFGSFSKGNYTPESDIDLLVLVEHSNLPFLQRHTHFISYFVEIPFDINMMVYTRDEFENMLKEKNHFILNIRDEAIEL